MYMLESLPLYIGKHLLNGPCSLCLSRSYAFGSQNRSRANRGFSLIEAVIVLFILSITAAAVVPNLISWRAGMRLQGTINELLGDLQAAKTLAAKHNTTVAVEFEPAENQYQITYMNSDGQTIALKQETLPPEIRIDSSHPDYTLNNHQLAFTSRGGATPGTLVVSNTSKKSRKIVISSIGKIRTENLK